jgi:DNA replicative helicase MCM subunit Mcm2 (Cdc46/Mcm family)
MFEEIDEKTQELFKQLADSKEKCKTFGNGKIETSQSFTRLPKYICPNLVGEDFDLIRQTTLLMMVTHNDTAQTRMRLHELLVGEPGTGKTEFMLDWNENYEGVFVNAEHASKAGLCGDARGSGSPGVLTTFTNNIILIDELDKMKTADQSGLLQAMGEGQYTITKGKIHKTFPAEIRAIASANDVKKIQRPLVDRFDFIFYLDRPERKERADTIPRIVDSFFGEIDKKKTQILSSYLKWIADFKPILVKEDLNTIYKFLQTYITDTQTDIDKISRRNLEYSILRIAYALAKLEKKNITKTHVRNAILFKDKIVSKYKMGMKK